MTVRERLLRPTVLFWIFLIIALATVPAATFLCDASAFLTPFGGIGIVQTFLGSQGNLLPVPCQQTSFMTDLSIHLVLLSVLVAHALTIIAFNFAPKTDEPYLLCSKEYMKLILKTVLGCLIAAGGVCLFAGWAMQTPEIALWFKENTTLQSPVQVLLTLAIVVSLITIVLAGWHEDRFAFWDALFFCIELIILLYEIVFLTAGIDLVIVLLSLPFPAFTEHFNPVFPPMWREWYKDFQ